MRYEPAPMQRGGGLSRSVVGQRAKDSSEMNADCGAVDPALGRAKAPGASSATVKVVLWRWAMVRLVEKAQHGRLPPQARELSRAESAPYLPRPSSAAWPKRSSSHRKPSGMPPWRSTIRRRHRRWPQCDQPSQLKHAHHQAPQRRRGRAWWASQTGTRWRLRKPAQTTTPAAPRLRSCVWQKC